MAKRELESARNIAKRTNVREHKVIRLPDMREARDIPGFDLRGLPPTYVPLRNSIFYSFAASYAEEVSAASIVGGHNKEDEKIFEDAGPEFFDSLQTALWTSSPVLRKNRMQILRPLKKLDKADIVRLSALRGVPLELTWSCHRSGNQHCWKCEGCLSRRRAFVKAGVKDPLWLGA
jgi:7-cyano-7-deazaguanine synthase